MKKLSVKDILIIFLVLINLYALFELMKSTKQKKDLNFLNKENINQLQYARDQVRRAKENMEFSLQANNRNFLFTDSLPTKRLLPTLVLRVHSNDCNECIKESLFLIKNQNVNNQYSIIVLADFPTLKAFTDNYIVDYPVYLTSTIGPDSLYTSSKPYYFTVTNGRMAHFFIPEWDAMPLFKTYIDELLTIKKN